MLNEQISNIRNEFNKLIIEAKSLSDIENVRVKFLSRNGLLSQLFDKLKDIPKEHKPTLGKELNILRTELSEKFDSKRKELEAVQLKDKSIIDLTLPGNEYRIGRKHILTQTLDEIKNIFKSLGFSVYEGPEIESDYYNFEALNFPADHPARDMQDTFFISEKFLLRTHTTPVQIRILENNKPPVRAIMPGRVYRNEAVSSRSYCMFHQVDGIYVDTDVTFTELKGTLVSFAKQFYGEELKYRFRPSFFPFTEPSAEMDITCFLCKGSGCKICKNSGWLEILGCGMVDPNVFKFVDVNPDKFTGYAFGMGIERIGLLKYGITDIRMYFENDLRFLNQF